MVSTSALATLHMLAGSVMLQFMADFFMSHSCF